VGRVHKKALEADHTADETGKKAGVAAHGLK
jgi:hypothetical protein